MDFSEDWSEAIFEAKEELGYDQREYVKDWDSVVELAKEIMSGWRLEERDEKKEEYNNYLKSEEWKQLRKKILKNIKYLCIDCGGRATSVHHISYEKLYTNKENEDLVPLCDLCHKKRHGLIKERTMYFDVNWDKLYVNFSDGIVIHKQQVMTLAEFNKKHRKINIITIKK